MRLSGFILGGIVGMAAAAYMAQKRPGSLAWAGNATGQLVSGMKGRILETALTRKFGADAAPKEPHKKSAGETAKSEESWETIEHLLSSDPEAKAAANEIIADSGSGSSAASSSSHASH